MRARPAPVGNIRNTKVASKEFVILESIIEYGQQAFRFVLIAVDDRLNLVRRIAIKNIGLSHHRADATHLEHQPLNHE